MKYPLPLRQGILLRRFGESTRFDFLLTRGLGKCFVEVKSVTLVGEDRLSAFPDAVTARGVKHIRGLLAARKARSQGRTRGNPKKPNPTRTD